MKSLQLKQIKHGYKAGMECPEIEPNILEDCLLMDGDEIVGFFIKKIDGKIAQCADYCNNELRSDNVPKSTMKRSGGVLQYSTIIGSIPKKPHMRRDYKMISSVHRHKSAENFIKGMKLLAVYSEKLIKKYMPDQYEKQKRILKKDCLKKFRFSDLFTSSISNFNIAANFHVDNANLKDCLNVIISKREGSTGGNTYVPDYDACFDMSDGAMLVYPAWKSLHGVTPIVEKMVGGYRNTLVFYPLRGFDTEN